MTFSGVGRFVTLDEASRTAHTIDSRVARDQAMAHGTSRNHLEACSGVVNGNGDGLLLNWVTKSGDKFLELDEVFAAPNVTVTQRAGDGGSRRDGDLVPLWFDAEGEAFREERVRINGRPVFDFRIQVDFLLEVSW